jgi:hypothetical protein
MRPLNVQTVTKIFGGVFGRAEIALAQVWLLSGILTPLGGAERLRTSWLPSAL